MKIAIIDYGVGNTLSVYNAIRYLGYEASLSRSESVIAKADALVLPGVGAFEPAIRNIHQYGLKDILNEQVLGLGKPIVGICLGMQLMAESSDENGHHQGLGWIPGQVRRLELPHPLTVPHVGWQDVTTRPDEPMFSRLGANPHFYFDHSYHFICEPQYRAAWCDYGTQVTAAVRNGHIMGVQFHPEKSQNNGLKLFRGIFQNIAQQNSLCSKSA